MYVKILLKSLNYFARFTRIFKNWLITASVTKPITQRAMNQNQGFFGSFDVILVHRFFTGFASKYIIRVSGIT